MKTLTIQFAIVAAMLASSASLAAVEPEARILRIVNPPQSNGIHIGDVLQRKVKIELKQPYAISKTAFPLKGSNTQGMELVDISVRTDAGDDKTVYTIALSYQVFAHANSPVVMQLPAQSLAVTGGNKAITLNLPPWRFWFSPLVAAADIADARASLQPSQRPVLVDVSGHKARLAMFAGLFMVGLIALVYINADRRWLPFMGGPFAHAHRRIKRLQKNPAQQEQALLHLHQAFNRTFGANLFSSNIQQFLAQHPKFAGLKAEIEAFFEKSNRALFAGAAGAHDTSVQELLTLSRQLRDSERGV